MNPPTAVGTGEDLHALVVAASSDALFCQDPAGTVLTWNRAAEVLYGVATAEAVGQRLDQVLPTQTTHQLAAGVELALTGALTERAQARHHRADGTEVEVAVTVAPLRDESGRIVAVATAVSDIADRVRLAAELEQTRARLERHNDALARSNRDLEQFAYVASHDLSEPLRVMTSYIELLERRYDALLDERGRRYMRHVVDASQRMRQLIDDLLDYSRFLRAPRRAVQVDAEAVAKRARSRLAATLRESGGAVEIGPLPRIWSDEQQLESLLQNLISNAVKFTEPGRGAQVFVTARQEPGWVTLLVDDAGIGIEPEYRDRVFRMFQRLHVREAYPGTGIGLAIAQQIVELHGGRIWVEDSPLGGARFCCSLPAEPCTDKEAS